MQRRAFGSGRLDFHNWVFSAVGGGALQILVRGFVATTPFETYVKRSIWVRGFAFGATTSFEAIVCRCERLDEPGLT
jgi:succinate dehydrogenase hydrophobic anchor subunit